MALAKVTIEALTQMANTLRQSADDILLTKEQMDRELYSIHRFKYVYEKGSEKISDPILNLK